MKMCSIDDKTPTSTQSVSTFEKVENFIAALRETRTPFPVNARTGGAHLPYVAAKCGVPEYLLKTEAIRSAFDAAMKAIGTQPVIILSPTGLKLANFITCALHDGKAMPVRKDNNKPCFKTIAQQTGISATLLQHNLPMRRLLSHWRGESQNLQSRAGRSQLVLGEAWLRQSKYPNKKGTTYVTVVTPELACLAKSTDAAVAPPRQLSRDIVILEIYIENLAKSLAGVPALPGRSSCAAAAAAESDDSVFARLNLPAISNDCRFGKVIHLDKEPFKTVLIEGARRLGTTEYFTSKLTIKFFRTEVVEKRQREVAAGKSPKSATQQAYNMNSALTAFLKASGLSEEDTMEALFFSPEYASYYNIFQSRFTNHHTAKKYDLELRRLREYAIAMRRIDGLPPQFSAALNELMKRANLTVSEAARTAQIDQTVFATWCAGGQPTSPDPETLDRLEKTLHLPPGTLQSFLADRRQTFVTDDLLTDDVKLRFGHAGVPLSILPHGWSTMPREDRASSLKWVFDNIIDADPYASYIREVGSEGKIHENMAGLMSTDYKRLSRFKTDEVADPVISRRKSKSGRGRGKAKSGKWRGTTEKKVRAELARLRTGLLMASAEHAADSHSAAECHSLVDKQGLGYLANASCVRAAFNQIARRRFEMLSRARFFSLTGITAPESMSVYAQSDATLCQIIAAWFHVETGYFRHTRPTIGEIPGLIDAEWLSRAEKDWASVAQTAYDQLTNLAKEMEDLAKQIRNPWHRIEPLLDRADPLTPLFDALEKNAKCIPGFHAGPVALAKHHRRHLIVHMLVVARLRAGNVRNLTWHSNNKGQLRKAGDGNWYIVIEQSLIKNEGSSALPSGGRPLTIELDPCDRLLHETLDDYLLGPGATRNALCPTKETTLVFPGKFEDKPLSSKAFYYQVAQFATKHLVYTPWFSSGIQGVLPFGPHAIRHVIATHVIKVTGLAEAAANAIFDTVATVKKTYARFLSVDKSRLSNQIIRDSVRDNKRRD